MRPEPLLVEFLNHFESLFGRAAYCELSEIILTTIDAIPHVPFSLSKIEFAARQMKSHKTIALAAFPIDYLYDHSLPDLQHCLTTFFNSYISM